MKSALAKMFLLALPLAGVLMAAPPADAHGWRHQHHHCRPYAERGWYRGDRYNNGYYGRRGWYEDRRNRYDDYPSRYQYQRYDDPRYYGGGYPWWSAWLPR